MWEYLPSDYHAWLAHGHVYHLPNWQENGRIAMVTAKLSNTGGIWLLYEHAGEGLDLRYWVMPDGGISLAREEGARRGTVLNVLPPLANVRELRDTTDDLDPDLRRQLEELFRELDEQRGKQDN